MKLITELTHDVEQKSFIDEASGEKQLYIEGIFMQAEAKNHNGRYYHKSILESAVGQYVQDKVSIGRGQGELDHPVGPKINSERISHRITELKWSGNDVVGKALILNTPMGNLVRGLVEGGVKIGVSSRGMGTITVKNRIGYVDDGYMLATVDVVQDPSAPEAFVNGIMEGVEWSIDGSVIKGDVCEKYRTEIRKAPRSKILEAQERVFADFLLKLKNK